jgi:LysR family hydrogen peroxide-inducible transcriptional activator
MSSITQLEYALAVDTHRHFARAANACFVTQPTLSAQLSKLEDELGVVLFDRSAKPIVPTIQGIAILTQARQVIAEFRKIQAIASGASTEVSGDFVIGVIPTVAAYLVPLFMENLSTGYPKLKIEVKELTTGEMIQALEREMIDVGILAIPVDGVSYTTEVLYTEPFYLYVHKDHELAKRKKIAPGDIDGDGLWLLEEGHCLRGQILQACKLHGRKPALSNVRFESGSVETLKRLVSQGLGYTLVPHLATDLESATDDEVKILAFESPVPARDIGLMYRRTQLKMPALKVLGDVVKKNLPQSLIEAGKRARVIAVKDS